MRKRTRWSAGALLAAGILPAGSMGPKVAACCRFVAGGGRFAAIGELEAALETLEGRSGTRIV